MGLFKKKKTTPTDQQHSTTNHQPSPEQEQPQKKGLFNRFKKGLKKTRQKLTGGLGELLLGKKIIDEDLIDDLEMQLLSADIGVEATQKVMDTVRRQVDRQEIQTIESLSDLIKSQLTDIIAPCEQPLNIDTAAHQPYIILVVGVNGVGKTTTIGKLAQKFQNEGKSVMLAAGDTFRAAAVEQLETWGQRNNVDVIAQKHGADSASVIYDAIAAAKARSTDIVLADTAGRLHNKSNLMEELKKIVRVTKKLDDSAPHEVMLVLDAGTGQNALAQAETFQKAVNVSGITLTKMDGTAKGGIIFAIAQQHNIPIRFIGVGETLDDLSSFQAEPFIEALFDLDSA